MTDRNVYIRNTDGLGRVIAHCAYTGVRTVDKVGTVLSTLAGNKLLLSYTTGIHAGVRRLFSAEAGTTDARTVLSTGADARIEGAHVAHGVGRPLRIFYGDEHWRSGTPGIETTERNTRFIIMLLCLAQSCIWLNSIVTLTSEFFGTKRVESSPNLTSSLLQDSVV